MKDLDAYGQISSRDDYWWTPPPRQRGGVLFVDADLSGKGSDPESVADRLRSVPPQVTALATTLAIRVASDLRADLAEEFGEAVRVTLDRMDWWPQVRLLRFPFGATAREQVVDLNGDVAGPTAAEAELLGRCRACELGALLRRNNAVWEPRAYHYRMPGGAHSTVFVRLADAIRTPRDAYCLASWLAGKATEGAGVVIDTSSITPLVLALELLAVAADSRLGATRSLETYPSTRLDAMRAVRDVDDGENSILAVLSVHATGTLRDRFATALDQAVSGRWTLDVVVDKAGTDDPGPMLEAPGTADAPIDRIDTWVALGAVADATPERCTACRSDAARLVQIDPRTFDGMVLPEPDLMMPAAPWASRQRDFWELVDRADALFLETTSDVSTGHPRHALDKLIGVKVDFDVLLAEANYRDFASATASRLLSRTADLRKRYSLVLVNENDATRRNFPAFVNEVLAPIDSPNWLPVPPNPPAEWDAELTEAVCGAETILLFSLGLVSGLSLQRLLFAVQAMRRALDSPYELDALVVHVRPTSPRVRDTVANAINERRLVALWESFLPDDRFPLQEEHAVLELLGSLSEDADAFREMRLQACSNFAATDQILWGVGPHDGPDAARLSPMSYFGEALRARAAFAAVGAAVQHARTHIDRVSGAPLWRMFEMPAIVRSYYDPVIVGSILRWIRATEAWWGTSAREAELAVDHLLGRSTEAELAALLPEVLLAAAQGKVPRVTFEALRARATIAAQTLSQKEAAPIRVGLALLDAVERSSESDEQATSGGLGTLSPEIEGEHPDERDA